MTKKRSLVLSGGGSSAAYQIGVLKALTENNISWDTIHGVSAGSLNGAFLAMFNKHEQKIAVIELEKIWREIKDNSQFYVPWVSNKLKYIWSAWRGSLEDTTPLKNFIKNKIEIEKLVSSDVNYTVGAVSLNTGLYVTINKLEADIHDWILASSSFPIAFPPVKINNEYYSDGGTRHAAPIIDALNQKPDIIDVILSNPISVNRLSPLKTTLLKSTPKIAFRIAEIMIDEVFISDVYEIYNFKHPNIEVNIYTPKTKINTNPLKFFPDIISKNIDFGYIETIEKLSK